MRVIKCGFSKTFPLQQYYEKIWLEAELNEGDDERQALYDLKKKVESFFFESTKAAEKIIKQNGQEQQVNKDQDEKTDREFEEVKTKLQSFKYREQAQEYLDTTDFKMTVAAKNIVNNIKPKPTPK